MANDGDSVAANLELLPDQTITQVWHASGRLVGGLTHVAPSREPVAGSTPVTLMHCAVPGDDWTAIKQAGF